MFSGNTVCRRRSNSIRATRTSRVGAPRRSPRRKGGWPGRWDLASLPCRGLISYQMLRVEFLTRGTQ